MADETNPQPNLVEQYAQSVNQRKLEAEAQMQKLIDSLNVRKNMPFDPALMGLARGLLAPTKTGSFGESLGYGLGNLSEEAQKRAAQDVERAKMEFELRQRQAEQQQAADAMKFRMQYFGGKPQGAAPVAPAAAPAAPPTVAKPLTDVPQMSDQQAPAVLPEDMSKAPPPAAPVAPTTYTPRFSASDLAVLGVVDKESFDLATKLEEQQRKTAELAAKEREARAKELEQELKQNAVNVFGTTVPFTKEQRAAIEEGIRTNNVSALDEIFMLKGIQSPYVLRDGKVKVLPQEEWTAKQKAAETLGMVKRTIRGKDYEMTAPEALEHDEAKRAGRDKYRSWVNNFFEQGSELYAEPAAPSAAPSAAAPSAAAPSAAAPAKASVKAESPLSVGEKEVKQVGETKTVEANIAAQAKKSEELSAAVESSGERYQSASTILSLINDDKFAGAQGYFAQPGFKNAFVNFLKDGIRLGNYSLGVPALADALQQVGMTPAEAEAKATILQRSGELRMQLAAMLKGSVSNFEQVLLGNISGSVDTPLISMRAAMSTIQAKAIFDEKNQKAFESWREKNPYASPGKYTASDEYKSVRKGYLDQVVKINNFYFPKSKVNASSPATDTKPAPSGGKPKSSWLPQ
jgi:hypothetical protein